MADVREEQARWLAELEAERQTRLSDLNEAIRKCAAAGWSFEVRIEAESDTYSTYGERDFRDMFFSIPAGPPDDPGGVR